MQQPLYKRNYIKCGVVDNMTYSILLIVGGISVTTVLI